MAWSVVYFDGDDVGAKIELCLLREDVDGAAQFSAAVTSAIQALADSLRTRFGAEIKFAAGDEVLAVLPNLPSKQAMDFLRASFAERSGVTISCGVALDAHQAAINLHYAKLLGKNLTRRSISS